jgi:hypothetical protein
VSNLTNDYEKLLCENSFVENKSARGKYKKCRNLGSPCIQNPEHHLHISSVFTLEININSHFFRQIFMNHKMHWIGQNVERIVFNKSGGG